MNSTKDAETLGRYIDLHEKMYPNLQQVTTSIKRALNISRNLPNEILLGQGCELLFLAMAMAAHTYHKSINLVEIEELLAETLNLDPGYNKRLHMERVRLLHEALKHSQ